MEGQDNSALWASMLNNGSQWMNNPWIYFVFLALLGRNGGIFGNKGDCGLAQTVADNHNSDLLMGAIKGNSDAAAALAAILNCGVDSINAAIFNLKSAMEACCCQSQKDAIKAGYEAQISNLQQTNGLMSKLEQISSGMQTGFAQVGYATAQQTCEIKNNENLNTQRIIDTLNNHWTADLSQKYQDARLELSQLKQNETLIAALKTTA